MTNPIHTYADDSTLHSCLKRSTVAYRGQASAELNLHLTAIVDWGKNNLVEFNSRKTHLVLMSRRKDVSDFPAIVMNDSPLVQESSVSLLGTIISKNLCWKSHILAIARSASCKLGFLVRSKHLFSAAQRLILYKSQIRPVLEYCSHVWGGGASTHLAILDSIQRKAVRLVDDPSLTDSLQSLSHRRTVGGLSLFYRHYFGRCSDELALAVFLVALVWLLLPTPLWFLFSVAQLPRIRLLFFVVLPLFGIICLLMCFLLPSIFRVLKNPSTVLNSRKFFCSKGCL